MMEIQAGHYYMRRDGKRCKIYEVFERHAIGAVEYIPGTWLPMQVNADGTWMSDKAPGDIVSEIGL